MRKFKTSEDNRTNYIYFFDDGSKCVINPDEDGVDTTIIAKLHEMDDDTIDAERREEYHCPVRYENYYDGSGENANDRNPYLEDIGSDPLEMMLASISQQEHTEKLDRLKAALSNFSELQQNTVFKKFYQSMTNVDIAAEEGVTEAAVRNRLKKIFTRLAKEI